MFMRVLVTTITGCLVGLGVLVVVSAWVGGGDLLGTARSVGVLALTSGFAEEPLRPRMLMMIAGLLGAICQIAALVLLVGVMLRLVVRALRRAT